ncbi:MAG: hypothetical protein F6K40_39830 [Okeania sp. SIO3I5]|uniref:hypothetical protein n=1 Tax=Okeania sp. SIO3I5 TaxID=2607805 RepID=UPI0013BB8270|nr:hypothetical protein [Okeania sp. SIO3I5]NEQ42002.1 hypothetical protein [Okeania sp. SIO3I5]
MATITYCQALPEPLDELNALGMTKFQAFLVAYSPIIRKAVCETVQNLLSGSLFNKSKWNTYVQKAYQINKRYALWCNCICLWPGRVCQRVSSESH